MIDRVVGFQPVVRRKKQDNASQTSSKKDGSVSADSSASRPSTKKLYKDEPTGQQAKQDINAAGDGFSKNKAKIGAVKGPKQTQSEQQISSPQVRMIKTAKFPLTVQDMKNSSKLNLRQSAKLMRGSMIQAKPQEEPLSYKLKLIAFLLISLVLMINAMSPSRKAPARRR